MKAPKNEDQERQAAAAKLFAALLARTDRGRWVGFAGGTDEMIAWQQGGREGGSFRA